MRGETVHRWDPSLDRGLQAGLVAFRWLAGAWMVVIVVVDREALGRPWLAAALVGAAVVVTVLASVALRVGRLPTPRGIGAELVVGLTLSVADAYAWDAPHSQSLGSAWPLAGVLSAGLLFGASGGAAAGALIGAGRLAGTALEPGNTWTEDETLAAASTIVLYLLAGGISGFAATRLRGADRSLAVARAREEVAVELHDGVLQTLAVVQRRSDDADLVVLAREQERDLRDYLFGVDHPEQALATGLREVATRFERHHDGRAAVVLGGELDAVDDATCRDLIGAVGEAVTNAGKHGAASRVTIFAEPVDGGGLFVSVKDDGSGFDPSTTAPGVGLTRSIDERVARLGGRVEVDSAPGRGTEVRMWVPR